MIFVAFAVFTITVHERSRTQDAGEEVQRYAHLVVPHVARGDGEAARAFLQFVVSSDAFLSVSIIDETGRRFARAADSVARPYTDRLLGAVGLVRDQIVVRPITDGRLVYGELHAVWVNRNVFTYLFAFLLLALLSVIVRGATLLRHRGRRLHQLEQYQGHELERAEAVVRSHDARLKSIVSHAPVALFTLDCDGVFTFAEGRGLAMIGVETEGARGRSAFETWREFPSMIDAVRRAQAGHALSITATMGEAAFDFWFAPLSAPDAPPGGIIGVAADITRQKRTEVALRVSEERYALAARGANDGLWHWNVRSWGVRTEHPQQGP